MNKEELEKEATEYAQKLGAKDFIAKPKEIVAYFGYLAGAEPREKQIEELEKENADLKEEINKIAFARGNLEEENAELKGLKDVATLIRANNDTVTTLMQLNNMLVSKNQQLTKAKEIIKIFLKYEIRTLNIKDELADNIAKAEQFISEVEK